jgi:hypothetical protein
MNAIARRSRPNAHRGFLQVRPTKACVQSVEEAEREQPRRARESDDIAGIHESSGLEWISDDLCPARGVRLRDSLPLILM